MARPTLNTQHCENFKSLVTVTLYGCESWSFTLNEENFFQGVQPRLLKAVFGLLYDAVSFQTVWRQIVGW
jgi:hypothetical protein